MPFVACLGLACAVAPAVLVVGSHRQHPQAGEGVDVLGQDNRVALHPYLVHAHADVACVVGLAERVVRDGGDVVVLQTKMVL